MKITKCRHTLTGASMSAKKSFVVAIRRNRWHQLGFSLQQMSKVKTRRLKEATMMMIKRKKFLMMVVNVVPTATTMHSSLVKRNT